MKIYGTRGEMVEEKQMVSMIFHYRNRKQLLRDEEQ